MGGFKSVLLDQDHICQARVLENCDAAATASRGLETMTSELGRHFIFKDERPSMFCARESLQKSK